MNLRYISNSALGLALAAGILAGFTSKAPKSAATHACYMITEENTDGSRTIYSLDKANKLTKTTSYDADGDQKNNTVFTYGTSGKLMEEAFYSQGTDPDERVIMTTKYIYGENKVTATKLYETIGDGPTDQISFAKYKYNDKGLITKTTVYAHSFSDVPLNGFAYEYDEAGNLTRTVAYEYMDTDTVLNWTYEFTYDDKPNPKAAFRLPGLPETGTTVNNVLSEVKKNKDGKVLYAVNYTYEYNSNNLPSKRTATTASRPQPTVTTFKYSCP